MAKNTAKIELPTTPPVVENEELTTTPEVDTKETQPDPAAVDAPVEPIVPSVKLSADEINMGCVRPLRTRYFHKVTKMQMVLARFAALELAKDPKAYSMLWSLDDNKDLPVSEFEWEDGSTVGE